MNPIKTLAIAAAVAGLAACSGNSNDANNAMDMNATDMNAGMTDLNSMDMNAGGTINSADGMNATENAMVNDMTTNSPDTNLANGM